MNIHSQRGFAQIWIVGGLVALLLGTGTVAIKKGFGIFGTEDTAKAKAESAALVAANVEARTAEAAAAKARSEADAAQAQLAAQQTKRHEAVTEDIAGTVFALEQEPDPSLNVQAALTLSRSAFRNSDPIGDARLQAMHELVRSLTAQNAQIRATAAQQLADRDAKLEIERAKETSLTTELHAIVAAKASAEAKATALAAERDQAVTRTSVALDDVQTLGQKLESFGRWTVGTVVLLVVLLWVLPIIAKAFPGVPWLATVAKWSAGTIAGGLNALHAGEKKIAAQGLQEAGRALAAVRKEMPAIADQITDIFDRHVADANKPIVAAAAKTNP